VVGVPDARSNRCGPKIVIVSPVCTGTEALLGLLGRGRREFSPLAKAKGAIDASQTATIKTTVTQDREHNAGRAATTRLVSFAAISAKWFFWSIVLPHSRAFDKLFLAFQSSDAV
jgi:hypothetical protein